MPRKWFQLVGEDGNALTSADAVVVDIEDVDTLRKAVFAEVSRALPETVIAADLTVFANRAAYEAKQALGPRVSLANIDEDDTLIVQVPQKADSGM
ncbi:hypothetical protein ATCC90586_011164 [Pythium insidiosum]|nr:hypothetical protein ATCC90586_011164 [Pythium insidiosum]